MSIIEIIILSITFLINFCAIEYIIYAIRSMNRKYEELKKSVSNLNRLIIKQEVERIKKQKLEMYTDNDNK